MKIRITYGMTLLFLIWSFVSCGPKMRPVISPLSHVNSVSPPIYIEKHDTIQTPLTPSQLEYISKYVLHLNKTQSLLPEVSQLRLLLKQQNEIISQQTEENGSLAYTINDMRQRRIQQTTDYNKKIADRDKTIQSLFEQLIASQKLRDVENKDSNFRIFVLICILIVISVIMAFLVTRLGNRVNNLRKEFDQLKLDLI